MRQIASEALIGRLADWGVGTVFGLPGDGINGILEGLRRPQDRVGVGALHARQELLAAETLAAPAEANGGLGIKAERARRLAKKFAEALLKGQPRKAAICHHAIQGQDRLIEVLSGSASHQNQG